MTHWTRHSANESPTVFGGWCDDPIELRYERHLRYARAFGDAYVKLVLVAGLITVAAIIGHMLKIY